MRTKKSTEMPVNSSNPYNSADGDQDVPSHEEVMKLIGSLNVDAEIRKMLDAFYVNDAAELKFFSDTPAKGGKPLSPMDQGILATSIAVDSLDDVNVIMANDQQYGMFDVKKGKAKSIISPLASKN